MMTSAFTPKKPPRNSYVTVRILSVYHVVHVVHTHTTQTRQRHTCSSDYSIVDGARDIKYNHGYNRAIAMSMIQSPIYYTYVI
jgi:hypothetical protein